MRKLLTIIGILLSMQMWANPVDDLLERIDKGASAKFKTQLVKSDKDFFELDQAGNKVVIRGNSWVNIASGLNWYLKYYAGVHLSWNQMQAKLPAKLPAVTKKERRETDLSLRYDFNYCTFSYSMAFWDWKRWEKEIDWMALHGINMPLAIVGEECVWRNMLLKLGDVFPGIVLLKQSHHVLMNIRWFGCFPAPSHIRPFFIITNSKPSKR